MLGPRLKGVDAAWNKTCYVPVGALQKGFSACELKFMCKLSYIHIFKKKKKRCYLSVKSLNNQFLIKYCCPHRSKATPFWTTRSAAGSIYWSGMSQEREGKRRPFACPFEKLCAGVSEKQKPELSGSFALTYIPLTSVCEPIFRRNKHPGDVLVGWLYFYNTGWFLAGVSSFVLKINPSTLLPLGMVFPAWEPVIW